MTEKVGRNDLCPCGSGQKYKNCCLLKKQKKIALLGGRKFTAKVLSGKKEENVAQEKQQQEQMQAKAALDYATLMERSFGEALHQHEEKPPLPSTSFDYLVQNNQKEREENPSSP